MLKFWSFFIDHRKFTNILVLFIILAGLFSAASMRKESTPEINVPIAVMVTPFLGASSTDVELLVTKPIEDRVLSMDGVDSVSSSSSKGLSVITVQFFPDEDITQKVFDLKDAADLAQAADLPDDASETSVQKISFNDQPILTFALGGPYSLPELTVMAEDLKDEIERIKDVSEVQVLGGLDEEIQVRVDQEALESFGMNILEVSSAIQQANSDIPVGSIETGNENFTLRLEGQLESTLDVANVVIKTNNGVPVYVRDVAVVEATYEDQNAISRLSLNGQPSVEAVSIRTFKVPEGDILDMADAILEYVDNTEVIPSDVEILLIEDSAKYIRNDLGNLLQNGIQTVIIVILLLLLFLGWREALIAGLSIPLTFLITFIGLYSIGYTLNGLTLFSLILSLGILVDSSIVISESIYTKRQTGLSPRDAAIETVRDYQYPLAAGVLTTVFAFVPMLLVSGILGEFIKSIPVAVSIVLMASLFVGMAVVTTMATQLFKEEKSKPGRVQIFKNEVLQAATEIYSDILTSFIESKWRSRFLAMTLVGLFVASLALPVLGILNVQMFLSGDEDTLYIDVEEPIGTTMDEMKDILNHLEVALIGDERIESFTLTVGSSSGAGSVLDGGANSNSHLASSVITLKEEREQTSQEIIQDLQNKLNIAIPSKVNVTQLSDGPGDAQPVVVRIKGEDLATLDQIAAQVEKLLEEIPGTQNIQNSVVETNGELAFEVDRSEMSTYGLNMQQLSFMMNTAISGAKATTIRQAGDNFDVRVEMDWTDKISPAKIEAFIGPFVDVYLDNSRSTIAHLEGDRLVQVTSNVDVGVTPQVVFQALEAEFPSLNVPDGYVLETGGEQEDIEQSFRELNQAFLLAVFLIGGLLVLQFNSYRQPLFILVSIPLSLIGVLPGLVLMGQTLSFPGLIGVVALSGIVVNNAIILIDQINQNRRDEMPVQMAIIKACESRFQPIVLTTITTVAGILPLAISDDTWGPLGYAIVFGLLFSTLLTLVVVPVLYERFTKE